MANPNNLKSFYYTFGTSDSHPFKKGWVEVKAEDRSSADKLFRMHYPDRFPGLLNCSSVFPQDVFRKIQQESPWPEDWKICHAVITPEHEEEHHHIVTAEDVCNTLRTANQQGNGHAARVGQIMYQMYGGQDIIPQDDLKQLAEKIAAIPSSCEHAFSDEEAISVVRDLCRRGIEFSGAVSVGDWYCLLTLNAPSDFSPEATRKALIIMEDDEFAELIALCMDINRENSFSGRNTNQDIPVDYNPVDAFKDALFNAQNALREPFDDKVRNAQQRVASVSEGKDNVIKGRDTGPEME